MKKEISELLKNPEFMEKIMQEKDKDKVRKLFSEKGIDLSGEELDNLGAEIYDLLRLASELSDDQVANVSGGKLRFTIFKSVYKKCKELLNLPPEEKVEEVNEQIGKSEQMYREESTPDTWLDVANRNKGKLSVGAVALALCTVYGVKNIKRYLRNSKTQKNWINTKKSGK